MGLVFLLLYFPKDVGLIIGLNQSVEFFSILILRDTENHYD